MCDFIGTTVLTFGEVERSRSPVQQTVVGRSDLTECSNPQDLINCLSKSKNKPDIVTDKQISCSGTAGLLRKESLTEIQAANFDKLVV